MQYSASPNAMKGYSSMYTGCNASRDQVAMAQQYGFVKGQRRRMNIISILISLFVPWLLFCFVCAILSFSVHFTQPTVAFAMVILAFLIVVGSTSMLAANAMKRKLTDPMYEPSWFLFLAGTCFLAFFLAYTAGQWNYSNNMHKYYNLLHLPHYQDVDTNSFLGQQLMDAGRIEFKNGTALDLGRSMGFKNHDVYCVSPIITKGAPASSQPLSVDFWAVGKNCCSGVQADFHCDGFSDPNARGVIRLMHDADRPFYRLAVQQAEATYKMTATHPLFFEWVHSAEEATNQFAQIGRVNYFLGICSHFLLQAFLTVTTTLLFSKTINL
jgi:hypothetical protein